MRLRAGTNLAVSDPLYSVRTGLSSLFVAEVSTAERVKIIIMADTNPAGVALPLFERPA